MKKLLYTLVLIIPALVLGQSTNQNYVKSTTFNKEIREQATTVTNPDGSTTVIKSINQANEKDKIEQVTYYDGLGRPMQSVAHKAGGAINAVNELDYDWSIGDITSTFFRQIGQASENEIVNGETPFGDTDLLWKCGNDVDSNADGGWNTREFPVDNTKSYRYTTWVKKTSDLVNGNTYHGVQHVNNLDGTANGNPYFWLGDLPQLDTWYLLVGVVHPYDYNGPDTGESGVYDVDGNKVLDGTEFKWKSGTNFSYFRNYLYYSTNTSVRQYFYKPLLQKLNGNQWTLQEIANDVNAKDVVTHIEYDAIGRQAKTHLPYADTQASTPLEYRTNAEGATNSYYIANYSTDIDNSLPNPFSEIEHETSPLNRVLQQAAPGKDWSLTSGHTIKFDYQTNLANKVRNYEVSFIGNDYKQPKLIYNGNYAPNELYKTITKDENWVPADSLSRTTEEFKDKLGRVILKRTYVKNTDGAQDILLDTQYVYDDFGNLTYVLSPKGSDTVLTMNQYTDFSDTISATHFALGSKSAGPHTGSATVSLTGTTLTLNLNIQFSYNALVTTGSIHQLSQAIPNVDFNTSGSLNGYGFSIENGYLTATYLNSGAPAQLSSLNGTFTVEVPEYSIHQDQLDGLCYQYKYDERNRLIEKKIPQKGWEYIVYDNLDRPTLTQDQNLKAQNKWLFTKYDAFGRVVYTGYYNSSESRATLQNTLNTRPNNHEEKTVTNSPINNSPCFYTNNIFPNTNIDLLTINYYDNYTFDTVLPLATTIIFDENITTQTKGLATGSKVRVLGTNDWITTFTQYDKKARAIYIVSKNEYLNTIDIVKTDYDFIGNVLKTESSHTFGSNAAIVTVDEFKYDHQNRLLTQKQTINGGAKETIVNNTYDDLGQLVKKGVGNNASMPLQNVDYKYNIRGWLTAINNVEQSTNDLFSFKLNYNTVEGDLASSTPKLYNGNIAQTIWKSSADNEKRSYAYNYDALNRITSGYTRMGAALDTNMNFDLHGVMYDKNGNILDLNRKDVAGVSMDELDYTYEFNQLTKVTDNGNTEGFKDGADEIEEYHYDENGNMTSDANKKITSIEYNHLNLPTKVTFSNNDANVAGAGEIEYVYDATGVKLKKFAKEATLSSGTSTFYAGNYIYKQGPGQSNAGLEFFNHPEGYVEPTQNTERPFQYIYQYKDHLGNIRLSYRDQTGNYRVLDDSKFNDNVLEGWSMFVGAGNTISVENNKLKVDFTNSYGEVWKDYVGLNGQGNNIKIELDVDTGADTNPLHIIIVEYDANYVGLETNYTYNIASGRNSIQYQTTDENTAIVRVFIRKTNPTTGTSNHFYVDNINITSGELEIMENKAYYPFGLKHNYGTSSPLSSISGSPHPYGYNGMEETGDFDFHINEMAMRQYDPAIARWTVIDPVTHFNYSPYQAFDNNPIFWADPSGADSEINTGTLLQNMFNASGSGTTWYNSGNGSFSTGSGNGGGGTNPWEEFFANKTTESDDTGGGEIKLSNGKKMVIGVDGVEIIEDGFSEFANGTANYLSWMGAWSGVLSTTIFKPGGIGDPFHYRKIYDAYSLTGKSFYLHNPNVVYDMARSRFMGNVGGLTKGGNAFGYASMGISLMQYAYDGNYGYAFGPNNKYAKETELALDLTMTRVGMMPNPYAIGGSLFYFYIMKPMAAGTQRYIDEKFGGDRKAWRESMTLGRDGGYCFTAGTKISMSNNGFKAIEDVKVGDYVKTFNIETNKIEISKVLRIDTPIHSNLVKVGFSDNTINNNTQDHPYYVKNKGWASVNPELTYKNYGFKVNKLDIGDICFKLINKNELIEIKVVNFTINKLQQKTFNLSDVEKNNNFFANGVLVHNKFNKE
ncbi:DUF6443 domain-containing protein [Pseudofulvibacter geojedonensis]|uniref:DUF6443 domain-containing protein n=1 Tax=Pseudofulvibacter geojedonensis TaxID=1123758 RepID=A0ABW3I1R8_9FLAO